MTVGIYRRLGLLLSVSIFGASPVSAGDASADLMAAASGQAAMAEYIDPLVRTLGSAVFLQYNLLLGRLCSCSAMCKYTQ